jgi:hypothetical protein
MIIELIFGEYQSQPPSCHTQHILYFSGCGKLVAKVDTNSLAGCSYVIDSIIETSLEEREGSWMISVVHFAHNQDETLKHLFFDYTFSQWCWRLLDITWSQFDSYLDKVIDGRRRFDRRIFRGIFVICFFDSHSKKHTLTTRTHTHPYEYT